MGLNDVSDDLGEEGMTMFDFNIFLSLGVPIIITSTSQCRWVIFPENKNNKIKHCLKHLVVKIQKKIQNKKKNTNSKKANRKILTSAATACVTWRPVISPLLTHLH